MRAIGIVSEYNPIHNGHTYHMAKSREIQGNKAIVLVMSGNFVQRGEAAVMPKSVRTKMALSAGADLVIELPALFATSSAESFAAMSLRLLGGTKLVDTLSFGSEAGDLAPLDSVASYLASESADYKTVLKAHLSEGYSFPKARALALNDTGRFNNEELAIINSPNNILGIEYLKAIHAYSLPLEPMTVRRIGAGYHDMAHSENYPSATAIRSYLEAGGNLSEFIGKMPEHAFDLMKKAIDASQGPVFKKDYFPYLKYRILTSSPEELSRIMDIGEGMEHRLIKCASISESYEELVDCIATKRYTGTRIARALIHVLLNIKKEDEALLKDIENPYLRILGFTNRGRRLLKAMKEYESDWPVIINVRDSYNHLTPLQRRLFDIDLRATAMYNQIIHDKYGIKLPNDFQVSVIRH